MRYAKKLAKLLEQSEEALKEIATKKRRAGDASVKTCSVCDEVITGADKTEVCASAARESYHWQQEYGSDEEEDGSDEEEDSSDGCGKLCHAACMKETKCEMTRLCRKCMQDFECHDCAECGTQH